MPDASGMCNEKQIIWIDIENTPHVLFFKPVIKMLKIRGYAVKVTARRCTQTIQLLDRMGISFDEIGSHYEGKYSWLKAVYVLCRVFQLCLWKRDKLINQAICHSSRSMLIASRIMGIKNLCFMDYEYVAMKVFRYCTDTLLIPQSISKEVFIQKGFSENRIKHLPGFKEQYYMTPVNPNDLIRKYNIRSSDIVVTLRPPAERAHYHQADSEKLWEELIRYLDSVKSSMRIFIIHRYPFQLEVTQKNIFFNRKNRFIFLDVPEDGMKLLALSDLVITGGGTMLREAVALGIPAYSFFTGKLGALDQTFIREGKLSQLLCLSDIKRIKLEKKIGIQASSQAQAIEDFIFHQIEQQ